MTTQNIKLTLEYDGTRFQGWHAQKKNPASTVSGRITEILRRATGEDIHLLCGEKTDPGVHAARQIVNFKTASGMGPDEIRQTLNRYLPLDIAVLDAALVPERFHAEFNTRSVTYRYRLLIGETEDVFSRKYTDFRRTLPDLAAMKDAALILTGTHDFAAFSDKRSKKSSIRTLECPDFFLGAPVMGRQTLDIQITGNNFLHLMPQKIIGALLAAGYTSHDAAYIREIFDGTSEAPHCYNRALFLTDVAQ